MTVHEHLPPDGTAEPRHYRDIAAVLKRIGNDLAALANAWEPGHQDAFDTINQDAAWDVHAKENGELEVAVPILQVILPLSLDELALAYFDVAANFEEGAIAARRIRS